MLYLDTYRIFAEEIELVNVWCRNINCLLIDARSGKKAAQIKLNKILNKTNDAM